MTDHIAVRCSRCGAVEFPQRPSDLRGWHFVYLPDGPVEHLIGALCSGCLTDEDQAEIEIRLATEDIAAGSTVNRLLVRPKDVNA